MRPHHPLFIERLDGTNRLPEVWEVVGCTDVARSEVEVQVPRVAVVTAVVGDTVGRPKTAIRTDINERSPGPETGGGEKDTV